MKKIFKPPTVKEAQLFCNKKNLNIDVLAWHMHHSNNAWRIRNRMMANWKLSLISASKGNAFPIRVTHTPKKGEDLFGFAHKELKKEDDSIRNIHAIIKDLKKSVAQVQTSYKTMLNLAHQNLVSKGVAPDMTYLDNRIDRVLNDIKKDNANTVIGQSNKMLNQISNTNERIVKLEAYINSRFFEIDNTIRALSSNNVNTYTFKQDIKKNHQSMIKKYLSIHDKVNGYVSDLNSLYKDMHLLRDIVMKTKQDTEEHNILIYLIKDDYKELNNKIDVINSKLFPPKRQWKIVSQIKKTWNKIIFYLTIK
jgi:chromosome segregation ATPase